MERVKSIAVIGGAGFIGSNFASRALRDADLERVLIYDNFSSGTEEHISKILEDPRVEVARGDLKDLDRLKEALVGTELVAHFAANPDIAAAAINPEIDFWEGTYLTHNLLEAVRINNVKFMLYSSGSGVYGDKDVVFKESYGPCFPISTYGASKLACEAMISSYCHMFGLVARSFRFANVVGPNQTHGVGYDFVRKLAFGAQTLDVLGDGSQTKSYIYVDDILDAMSVVQESMLSNTRVSYDVFNVATGDYITVQEIAEMAVKIASPGTRISYGSESRGWKGDVPVIRFNAEKIDSLSWRATKTSYQAMEESMRIMHERLIQDMGKNA
jgi:UDP-glucose 4-epimerase